MQQISATELNQRLLNKKSQLLLLDVREPNEYGYCHIEGSINVPMSRVFASLNELDRDRETVVICHHGMRSAQIAKFLIGQGFRNVSNLQGGVAAWASQVDLAMPTY